MFDIATYEAKIKFAGSFSVLILKSKQSESSYLCVFLCGIAARQNLLCSWSKTKFSCRNESCPVENYASDDLVSLWRFCNSPPHVNPPTPVEGEIGACAEDQGRVVLPPPLAPAF